jgi:hypothetical protein
MRLQGNKRIWIMNRAGHNPIGSTKQAKPLANRTGYLAIACNDETSQMSSAGQGREERDPGNSCSSRAFSHGCAELLHELANTTTAVLMNAQVLGWKLPPYSHLKRPLREIERNAQRGSELMKRLLRGLGSDGIDEPNHDQRCVEDNGMGSIDAVRAHAPEAGSGSAENPPPRTSSRPASARCLSPAVERKAELTSPCDACPSMFPKKG